MSMGAAGAADSPADPILYACGSQIIETLHCQAHKPAGPAMLELLFLKSTADLSLNHWHVFLISSGK